MTTCAPAKTVQQNFSLTLSICKHSRQLDTRCRPCTPHSRRQIYVQKEPCVFTVRSRLRNVKSLQTLHQFWSGFELRCLLPPNASVSPHQKQPTRVHVKKRGRRVSSFLFFDSPKWRVVVVADLNCWNSWSKSSSGQLVSPSSRKSCCKIFLHAAEPNLRDPVA